jgi:hypothetical protein
MDKFQIMMAGQPDEWVTMSEEGKFILDLENAPRDIVRTWCFQYGFPYDGETEELREAMISARDSSDFEGFFVQQDGEPPEEEGVPEAAEEEEEEEVEEEEEQEITSEEIMAMNWSQLKEIAGEIELEFADISRPPQPKVLRNRIIEALSGEEEEEEVEEVEEEATPADDDGEAGLELSEGDSISISHEGETYDGIFVQFDSDGDVEFIWEEGGDIQCVPADQVSVVSS